MKTVNKLKPYESGVVLSVGSSGALRRRIIDMGVTPGAIITMKKVAPFGDPIEINVRGYSLSIRKAEAREIIIEELNKDYIGEKKYDSTKKYKSYKKK
ncbi:MAG: ferrous iron transport protein A [Oscillospiraceae bacterium]|nr:ferrous iron transport protein A [Oscillospiraceae bacterium]